MHVSSRFAAGLAVALAVLITLGGIVVPTSQAQDQNSASCPQPCPQACPKPPECHVCVPDCTVPRIEQPCAPPPCDTCCPVDPKAVKKAQKEADHAAHEAAEACRKQHQTYEHQQHEVAERIDRANKRIDQASAHFEHERGEYQEALSKSATLNAQQQAQQSAAVECPSTKEEAATPAPAVCEPTPEVTPTPEPAPVPEAAPTPAPAPEPAPPISQEVAPKELPRTASPLDLIGIIGLVSTATGYYLTRSGRN
jgi:hypothetical protein